MVDATAPVTLAGATPALAIVRRIAATGLAGIVAGLVVGGLGGRLVMRLAAVLNPDATGIRTENGALIGAITLEGTLALLVFGGLFAGLFAAVVWVVASPWLPPAGIGRWIAVTVGAVALGSPFVVQSFNRDFAILDADVAIVAMLVGLAAAVGVSVAWLADRLDRRLPAADLPGPGLLYLLIVAAGAVVALIPTVGAFFSAEVCGCVTTPSWIGIALVATGVLAVVGWGMEIARRPPPLALLWAGRATLGAAVVLGGARTLGEARLILGF